RTLFTGQLNAERGGLATQFSINLGDALFLSMSLPTQKIMQKIMEHLQIIMMRN
ncbi:hypothetical protein CHS0354_028938, partial [Potamilus streckersoni]